MAAFNILPKEARRRVLLHILHPHPVHRRVPPEFTACRRSRRPDRLLPPPLSLKLRAQARVPRLHVSRRAGLSGSGGAAAGEKATKALKSRTDEKNGECRRRIDKNFCQNRRHPPPPTTAIRDELRSCRGPPATDQRQPPHPPYKSLNAAAYGGSPLHHCSSPYRFTLYELDRSKHDLKVHSWRLAGSRSKNSLTEEVDKGPIHRWLFGTAMADVLNEAFYRKKRTLCSPWDAFLPSRLSPRTMWDHISRKSTIMPILGMKNV
ncbi:vanillate O-demethylase oxygenase subunit [Striga asiatica]|uniref:Vanillate O-demethylase oxygenase subunit n=1 Tax=Striga asiatica TaxID=4170 RepID=A0A5A7QAW7_STRAF|nr:vanillate O-demethylase oxygenase subunit [Striga asiatica]